MVEVGATPGTEHFRPRHSEAAVRLLHNVQRRDWLVIAGPARPRFELGGTEKKVGATAHTPEDTRYVDLVKGAAARSFRCLPGGDFVLLLGQQLLPFRVRLLDFLYGHHLVLPSIINLDGCNTCTSPLAF